MTYVLTGRKVGLINVKNKKSKRRRGSKDSRHNGGYHYACKGYGSTA